MTPQEQKMLDDLMARVDSTRLEDKDPEAAQRIEQWIARNRDAAYILAQTVLVQSYALEQAKAQIQTLQQQIQSLQQQSQSSQQSKPASFLGSLFGHKEEPPAQQPSYAAPRQPGYAPPAGYAPVPQYGQQQYGQPVAPPPPAYGAPQGYAPAGGGGSSFLRSAATTAAGVAAGALAFEGIESLMHGFGHTAGFGGGGLGLGDMGGRPEETVINNYYDSPSGDRDTSSAADIQQFAHEGDSSLNTQQDTADDVNVGSDDQQLQADTDLPTLDDSGSYDDASLDDGGSFDDGGSSDDSLS